jgi:hypothetical protein
MEEIGCSYDKSIKGLGDDGENEHMQCPPASSNTTPSLKMLFALQQKHASATVSMKQYSQFLVGVPEA